MNKYFPEFPEDPETPLARRRRRIVGLLFILLPFAVSFTYGLWAETARPWITPMDLDETLMPLPALEERCINAVFSLPMLLTLPIQISGLALCAQRISICSLPFCTMGLAVYGVVLIGMFVRYSFAPGAPVPESLCGVNGILLFGFVPTALLSSLLLFLGKEGYVRLCALLPLIILGSLLLLMLISSFLR